MDHESTREQLELAAAEPGGLERLMAGDTPSAQAVAAHLAGCPSCSEELARIERSARVVGSAIRELPSPGLRERTLAAIRVAGVARGAPVSASHAPAAADSPSALGSLQGRRSRALGWVAAIAAAVAISVVATNVIVGGRLDERLTAQAQEIDALESVTLATLQVTAEPDVERVTMAGAQSDVAGHIAYSPRTTELVVVATGLTPPPEGQEYRCWVDQAGSRERVGKMFFSDNLAYWIGPVPAVEGLIEGATFGVSLVDAAGNLVPPDPVLDGRL